MRKTFLILGLIMSFCKTFAQSQEREVLLYNVGFGAFTSAVGAVVNKPKGADWKKYFIKGLWQGSIGGMMNYGGKKTLYLANKNENLIYAWPAKVLHASGSSIIENAALNEPFLQNWNIDYGVVRFDFSLKGTKPFKARFLPVAIYSIAKAGKNSRFDLEKTLLTGNIIFRSKNNFIQTQIGYFRGVSYGRALVYVDDTTSCEIIPHEIVHQFQYREYQVFNAWTKPFVNLVKSDKVKHLFENYIYPDIPYISLAYWLEGRHSYSTYNRNFYEFEAQRFSTNKLVLQR